MVGKKEMEETNMMKKKLVGIRLPLETLKAVDNKATEDKTDRTTAIIQLLEAGIYEYKKIQTIDKLRKNRMSISAAAKYLDTDAFEIMDIMKRNGITLQYPVEELKRQIDTIVSR